MKVASEKWEISISEVIKTPRLGGFLSEQAKGIFYILKINIKNLSKESAHLEGDLYLKDDQDTLFRGSGLGVIHAEDFGLDSPKKQILPEAETTIAAIYDVTPTASGLSLCWEPGWFTKPFVIDLQPYIKRESDLPSVKKQKPSPTKEQEKGFGYHYQKAHKQMYGNPYSKAKEVLDICLAAESPEVKAKVYEILEIGELDASDPMFLVSALTGQMRVLLEAAPADLSKLLTNCQEQSAHSLQQIQQAITQVRETQQQQADTIRQTLENVTTDCVENIKEVGMATTEAIASANNEVLTKSKETVLEIHSLKNQISSLKEVVEKDRETYLIVLNGLVSQAAQTQTELSEQSKETKTELDTSIQYIKSCYTALKKIQSGTAWLKWAEWFSPLTALAIVGLVSFGSGGWVMSLKYNDSLSVLGGNLVNWNTDRLLKCREDDNPKCTLWIVPPELRKK